MTEAREADQQLIEAVDHGDLEVVRLLLDATPALAEAHDPDGVPLLLRALYRGQAEIADVIAERRTHFDVLEASALGRADELRRLLENDSTAVAERSADGFTPLHYAAFFDRPEAAAALLAHGADVDAEASNPSRVRPLHSAAACRSLTVCRRLLEAGADPNRRQRGGFTALHSAALHGEAELVELLLEAGADPVISAEDGRTAADFAAEGGHTGIEQRLRTPLHRP